MTAREEAIAHAVACRDAVSRGEPRPYYTGPSLRGTVLSGADLSYIFLHSANLRGTHLFGANLFGAVLGRADLYRADLRGVDLRSASLYDADLTDAVLTGAVTDHGVVERYDACENGGYCWHAYITNGGVTWLRYGCDGATLDQWLERTSEYGRRHGHRPEHWRMGPAIAIAAAVRLRDGGAA